MANLLDQIGQRNVVRVISNGVPSSLESLSDTDFSGIGTGSVPVWNGEAFTPFVEGYQSNTSTVLLTVNAQTNATEWTDTVDGGYF